MADAKISDLNAAVTLTGVELVAGVQSGGNVKITIDQIKTYMQALPTLALGGASLGANVFAATGTATLNGGTVAANNPILNLTQTWNNVAIDFIGLQIAVTASAFSGSSSPFRVKVGASTVFDVRNDGIVSAAMFYTNNNAFSAGQAAGVNGASVNVGGIYGWTSGAVSLSAPDLILSRKAAASLQIGLADAAAPVAQTIGPQSVIAGTSNTSGAAFTIRGSAGTGTGAGGSLVFQVAPAGSTGSTQNPFTGILTLDSGLNATFAGNVNIAASASVGAGANFSWLGRTIAASPVNGNLRLTNNATTDFGLLQLGGTTSAFPAIKRNGAAIDIRLADDSGYAVLNASTINSSGGINAANGSGIGWSGRSIMGSAVDGNISLFNSTVTTFGLLQFGGTNNTAPALKRNGTAIDVKLADDSALTNLNSGPHSIGGATIGSDALAVTGTVAISGTTIIAGQNLNSLGIAVNAAGVLGFLGRAQTSSPAANSFQFGIPDSGTLAAQTIGPQNAATGLSNTAGANFTIRGSAGTGTGAGGSLVFQVAPAGSTGSTQNAQVTALTIAQDLSATFAGGITSAGGLSAFSITASSGGLINFVNRAILTSPATAVLQFGNVDVAAPTAQTIGAQSVVAGTTNTNGVNFTIRGSAGTGTGTGGSLIFQTAPASSTGSTQNAFVTALTINSVQQALFTDGISTSPSISFAGAPTAGLFRSVNFFGFSNPGNTVGTTGFQFYFNGNINNAVSILPNGIAINSSNLIQWSSSPGTGGGDLILTRKAAASLQIGDADAASPVAQTIGPQSVATGTSNGIGPDFTIRGSAGTGSSPGGNIIFQTSLAGGAGSTQNGYVTAMTIAPSRAVTFALTISSGAINSSGNINTGTGSLLFFSGRSVLSSPSDGNIRLTNQAQNDFGLLQFGGITSAFPALLRAATTLQVKLADASAFTNIQGKLTTDTNYTVGAAGAATGYLTLYDAAGTAYKVEARV